MTENYLSLANRVKDPKHIDSILSHSDIDTPNYYIEKGKRFLDMHLQKKKHTKQ